MFDPGGVGEWSPPQSLRVHPRSRAEGALGELGGRKENHNIFKSGGLCPGADSYSQQRMLCSGMKGCSEGAFASQIFNPYSTRDSQRGAYRHPVGRFLGSGGQPWIEESGPSSNPYGMEASKSCV